MKDADYLREERGEPIREKNWKRPLRCVNCPRSFYRYFTTEVNPRFVEKNQKSFQSSRFILEKCRNH
jgi:hypothetical protein